MKIDINKNIEEDISHFSKKLVKGEIYTLTYFNIDIPAKAGIFDFLFLFILLFIY